MSFSSTKTSALLGRILKSKQRTENNGVVQEDIQNLLHIAVPEEYKSFAQLPLYKEMAAMRDLAKTFHIENPFFKVHEGVAGASSSIGGKQFCNFSHYNYLGLAGHPKVNAAAKDAVENYGTSSGASRLVAGERPVQQALEQALARVYQAEACAVFVSGHATNVSTIRTLFGPHDLIVHDALIHNSILEGIQLSGATRRSFVHNDLDALDALLSGLRSKFQRVLIVVEGLYSMDGDIVDLPKAIAIKKRHGAFLMVDEAHALGVLGERGFGSGEHYAVDHSDVDIWMGTLSKTLASCGGYIAGSHVLIDILKHHAPGFVYSVGIAPPLAAASLAALNIMQDEPHRVQNLRDNTELFLQLAQEQGFDTGLSQGYSIVPLIFGSSRKAVNYSNALFSAQINVQPIIHPAVEEKASRLRFFLSSQHTKDDIINTIKTLKKIL